jgi:NADPH-dependent ferric siderophore reductase
MEHAELQRPRLAMALGRPSLPTLALTVATTGPVTPRMHRVSLVGDDLQAMMWRPGQDLVLAIPQGNDEVARRHYTIRGFDEIEQRIDIDFVLHGDSPAVRWATSVRTGEAITAHGPRGRTTLAAGARRHLFVGDETCIPAIMAMIEALPPAAAAQALIEVDSLDDVQSPTSQCALDMKWVFRCGAPAGPSELLLNALEEAKATPDETHAYVIGETSNVRTCRHFLLERGFDKTQIAAEGYWRPGRVGGHDHV